jgi:hypothetical protein
MKDMKIKTILRFILSPVRMAINKIKTKQKPKNADEGIGKKEALYPIGGNVN